MFTNRLKKLRQEAELTQGELAKQLNTSQQNIGHWETGRQRPKYEMLIELTSLFNVSIDYLLGKSDIPNPYAKSEFESLFNQLDDEQKEKAIRFLDNLIKEK
ncbi:TPA: helix-turn-helix transcriptional regulator [Streptococcus suis]|nr:helix-turn-helix transcriptional regulator [Streptococcus suis]HEM3649514.1 helix-turn-helix transcriptional regulator [Streptococcus suis]